jgi:serine protease Do
MVISRNRTRVLCVAAVAFSALVTATLPATAQPSSPEERAAAMARPAIVFITVNWHGWVRDKRTGEVFGGPEGYEVTTSCSGAVINPVGYVATASHCVHTGPDGGGGALFDAAIAELATLGRIGDPRRAKNEFAEHAVAEGAANDRPVDRQIQVERIVATSHGQTRDIAPATVEDLVTPADGDVAVLKIPRDQLPALETRADPPPVGTPILAIGYPGSSAKAVDQSLEPSNKNGQISAHRTQQGRPFYEFSAAATHGMSGGPVVDTQGRIVGLISQGSPGETQSFNFAAASSTLTDVLRRKAIAVELGAHDRDFRRGLDEYFAGDLDAAIEFFDAVLAAVPSHPQAAQYRRLAIEQGGVAGSNTTLLVGFAIGCAVLALLTGAPGILMLVPRRRAPGAAPALVMPPPLPVPLGDLPQHNGEGNTAKVDRRDRSLREDKTDKQTDSGGDQVEPGTPFSSEPSTEQTDDGHRAGHDDKTERLE